MGSLQFLPFYERLTTRIPGHIFSRASISIFLGLAFLAAQYASIGTCTFHDWSWFLALLITTMMLCLYIATYTLHELISRMAIYVPPDNQAYRVCLKHTLSDRNFVIAGSIFGALNCVIGNRFGLPYAGGQAIISILFGYFLVGFIGGMAVLGIYGVFVAVRLFSRELKPSLDFSSPDNCGGTLFIGEALVVFGAVTLIAGVMISIYILKTDWADPHTWAINALKGFWIVFPYIMSLVILIIPAIPVHVELRNYQLEQEEALKKQLATIRRLLENGQLDGTNRKELRDDLEFFQNVRLELHAMRLWPYGIGTSSKYIIILVTNITTTFSTISGWLKSLPFLALW
jgi:hypothetical protein